VPEPPPRGPRQKGKSTVNVSGVEKMLLGIHHILATTFATPEMDMNDAEAHAIADAWAEVSKYYPAFNPDPAHMALVNFSTVVCVSYGSKLMAWRMRKAAEKAQSPPRQRPAPQASPAATGPAPQPMSQHTLNGIPVPPKGGPQPGKAERTANIPGIGDIELPADHPLVTGKLQ
jgi:hypothetical protein